VGVNAALWAELGLQPGDRVRVSQGVGSVVLPVRVEPTLAWGCARVPAGHADTAALGAMSGHVTLERVAAPAAVPAPAPAGALA
jgi:NADH-quinone oxidoreductase subunit G